VIVGRRPGRRLRRRRPEPGSRVSRDVWGVDVAGPRPGRPSGPGWPHGGAATQTGRHNVTIVTQTHTHMYTMLQYNYTSYYTKSVVTSATKMKKALMISNGQTWLH
jgi:hypothetical protein